jgi:tripartite-type tricarboxylate transporter receptor subunit TctC
MVAFQQAFGKSYLVPPEVPAERVEVLRKAFAAALSDPELLAEADKLRIEIAAQSGEEVQRVVQNAYASTPAVVERLRRIVEP